MLKYPSLFLEFHVCFICGSDSLFIGKIYSTTELDKISHSLVAGVVVLKLLLLIWRFNITKLFS